MTIKGCLALRMYFGKPFSNIKKGKTIASLSHTCHTQLLRYNILPNLLLILPNLLILYFTD